jgi:hypothetical protein
MPHPSLGKLSFLERLWNRSGRRFNIASIGLFKYRRIQAIGRAVFDRCEANFKPGASCDRLGVLSGFVLFLSGQKATTPACVINLPSHLADESTRSCVMNMRPRFLRLGPLFTPFREVATKIMQARRGIHNSRTVHYADPARVLHQLPSPQGEEE